jgi:aminopeptidase N
LPGKLEWGPKELYGTIAYWELRPKKPIPANTAVVFAFSYSGGAEASPPQIFQVAPEGAFGNGSIYSWYPQILYPVIANPRTIGVVRYKIVGDELLLSAGRETTSAADRAEGFRRFESSYPSHFGFVAAKFPVQLASPTAPVTLYMTKERKHLSEAFPKFEQILELLQQWFGPYPQNRMRVVEAPAEGSFGSMLETIFFAGSGSLDEAFENTYYAHEIAHSWFGNKFDSTLAIGSEGMANYAALRFVEAVDGPAAARQFRLYGRPGYNDFQNALGYFRIVAAGADAPLTTRASNALQHQLSYSKGMLVLDMLSRHMGRGRFDGVFRTLMEMRPFQTHPWPHVQEALSRAAGEDLSWFFSQWMERTGAPDVSLDWKARRGQVRGVLRQSGDIYRLTLPVAIKLRSGRVLEKLVEMRSAQAAFDFPVAEPVASVELDPDYTVLRSTPELRALAEAMLPMTKVQNGGNFPESYAMLEAALAKPPKRDPYGVSFARLFALGRLNASEGKTAESVAAYRRAWEASPRRMDVFPWMLIRLARAAAGAKDHAMEQWAYERAVEVDRANPHSALGDEARIGLARLKRMVR